MFVFYKIITQLFLPTNLLVIACLAVWLLLLRGRWRAARRIMAGVAACYGVLMLTPIAAWLIHPLEQAYADDRQRPEHVDGVIVLGGGLDAAATQNSGRTAGGHSLARLLDMMVLGQRYPQATFIYSGGSGSVLHPEQREAPIARRLLQDMGFDVGRLLIDDQSRNTWENAIQSKALAGNVQGQTWILLTSAYHMPRAMWCFQSVGWQVIAYPTDYLTQPSDLRVPWLDMGKSLFILQIAIKEWGGRWLYPLMYEG